MNPFKAGDRIELWSGCDKPYPEDLVPYHAYVVEATVLDRVQVNGKLYFASRFMLLSDVGRK